MVNCKDLGLKKNYLYEIIATTYSIIKENNEIKPNASCMGIRMIDKDQIEITPFYGTTTYKNLKESSIITINLVDDVYLYALAALKEPNSPIGLTDFPSKYYDFKYLENLGIDVPYINKSWGLMIGKVSQEIQKTKRDDLGEIMIPIIKLNIILCEKLQESNKLFNRAENLALEIIILTTRLKIAKQNQDQSIFSKIYEKIVEHMRDIERFGKNESVLKIMEIVSSYIKKLAD
ncbi:MAG: DUF447 domain-containing protein [Promethearchaeota archaeon]